ncbi:MAG TPA: SxtJ family membrane protein [Thermoanaerobaculia bacterium]|nr:SxtJ family membrane protein [Thermoanaerobaculia bacterium]HQR68244.1 SxtJ family membrane protein [Thermoanaerobaculia bacterium]
MNPDRKFGLVVGGLLLAVGVLLLTWRHRTAAGTVLAAPGAVLLLLAAVAPSLLAAPHRGWLRFSHLLGTVNGFLFLSIVFFLILTPLGLFLRLLGRDELRRRGPAPASMWEPYPERNRDRTHFEKIF